MGELLAFLFVAFCAYNFRKGYNNPQKSEILVDGDYFPIGKVISQPVPQRTRSKPVKKKPEKPKDPAILEDCVAAAKSLGFQPSRPNSRLVFGEVKDAVAAWAEDRLRRRELFLNLRSQTLVATATAAIFGSSQAIFAFGCNDAFIVFSNVAAESFFGFCQFRSHPGQLRLQPRP